MQELVTVLISKNLQIASVESITAGLFASSIACIPQASKVLKGGYITYTNECKKKMLNIDDTFIAQHGVVSIACAKQMALQGYIALQSDIVVSFTGNAGPDAMENQPVGYVCMAILLHGELYSYEQVFSGNRMQIREACIQFITKELIYLLQGK